MAVDLGSRPFSTVYRPFRGSAEWVRIEWFPCAPGAKDLPFESCITNPFWERDQYEFEDGEEPLEEVIPTGKPRVKPGTGKGHWCGSEEDHREGGLYLPDEPPVVYGMLGLPQCCNPPVVMRGGVEDDGAAALPVVPGASCETAYVIPLGEWVTVTIPAGVEGWLKHTAPDGFSNRKISAEEVSNAPFLDLAYGFCPGPTSIGSLGLPDEFVFGGDVFGSSLFIAQPASVSDQVFRVRVDPAP